MDTTTDTITVQDASSAPAAPPPVESSGWMSLVPMVLIFVVFYFLPLYRIILFLLIFN